MKFQLTIVLDASSEEDARMVVRGMFESAFGNVAETWPAHCLAGLEQLAEATADEVAAEATVEANLEASASASTLAESATLPDK